MLAQALLLREGRARGPSRRRSPAIMGPVTSTVEIWSDGACKGNPGVGGWGAWLRSGDLERELYGGERTTTNNRMELLAAIRGLQALNKPCRVALHTDSIYVRDGITRWVHNWQRNGWRTSDRKPVKNAELWQDLIAACAPHRIAWHWVKGHSGHTENDRVDALACAEADRQKAELSKS